MYTVFYQDSKSGMPVARTLAIDYSFDDQIYHPAFQNQYLFGPSILVAPVESYKHINKVYLPAGTWYNFHSEEVYQGESHIYVESPISHLPLFVKAGAIVPMQSLVQSTQEQPEPTMYLHLYTGADGEFLYYEDDGTSYQYCDGHYCLRKFSLDHNAGKFLIGAAEGSYISRFKEIRCFLHGFEQRSEVKVQGKKAQVSEETIEFLPPVSSFDPLGRESISFPVQVQTFVIENSGEEIEVKF
jgi:alpha-glucosidase